MIDVCLLGTGGMMPLPDRYLTALYLRTDGRALLVDAGEGTQSAIRSASLRFKPIESVLLTHYHADHISGLIGLLLTLGNEDRSEPLHVYGPAGLRRVIGAMHSIVPELPFDLVLHEIFGETEFSAGGLSVTAYEADHGMPCLSYAFELKRFGRFDPEKARRNGVPMEYWSVLQKGQAAGGFEPDDVLGPARRGIRLVYSTDTLPLARTAELGAGSDLMILEGMFGGTDKDERAAFTHHSTMNQSAYLAKQAGAKELWLTHYSPANPHPHLYADEVRAIFPNTVISADGQKKTLKFED